MNNREIFYRMMQENMNEMNEVVDCLYTTSNSCAKNRLLNRLRKNISNLEMLAQGLQGSADSQNPQTAGARVFTPAELSRYNGKEGHPAYVAANGMVYDVTNTAAWAGATHFGLTAGRDVTNEFAACHAGQQILGKLKVVGKMSG